MNSLTEISVSVRKGLIFVVILVVGYLILSSIFNAIIASFRKPPPAFILQATNDFGKIPAPKFITSQNSAGINFVLENVEGRPPESTTAAMVYKFPQKIYTSQTIPRAIRFASQLGFTTTPTETTKNIYEFTDDKNPARHLILDIVSLNFKLKYDLASYPQILNNLVPTEKTEIDKDVRSHVSPYFDSNTTSGSVKSDYLIVNTNKTQLIGAPTKFDVPVGVVNYYFKADLDGMKVVTSTFFKSPVSVTYVMNTDEKQRILEMNYTYWLLSKETSGLYGLKTSVQAFQDLKDGYGAIINMGANTPDKVVIRSIYLAYYDSDDYQSYLQPIFVFEGDNDFIAYVPAVSSELLESLP